LLDGSDEHQSKIYYEASVLTLAIQAGGESRRMGSDKALLPFLGQPLIQRVLSRLAGIADEILITANQPERYRFLGITPIPDLMPGTGALGGVYTALGAASHMYVAVVACDMPFASPELFAYELATIRVADADVAIPRSEAGTEPFHAIYRRDSCLPHVWNALQAGKRRVDAWFDEVNMCYLKMEEIEPYSRQGLAFLNINTFEELQAAVELARKEATKT
jgi:molybdopterin-guanine dinucleotide biosynthesis protein A